MNKLRFLMAKVLGLISAQLLAMNPSLAASENSIIGTVQPGVYKENQFPSNFRVSALAAGVMPGSDSRPTGFSGALLVDYGRSWFGLEAGVQFLTMPVQTRVSDPNVGVVFNQGGSLMPMTINPQYVGVPLFVKYNYIEHPQAAFSVKLGAMPAFLMSDPRAGSFSDPSTGGSNSLEIPGSDLLVVGGFTGSAPLSDSLAFILDGTYYYGTTILDQYGNTRNQGVMMGVGLRYSL